MRSDLVDFLENEKCFGESQHGGLKGRSTLSQLLKQQEKILECLENSNNANIIYLDFEKAYDKVDLYILLKKMRYMGVSGVIGKWIGNFIS